MAEPIIERRISFSGGEISQLTDPRVDLEKYRVSCITLENYCPNIYGGAHRRPGTVFMGAAKHGDKKARLIPFEFSVTTRLVLELGDEYIRIWVPGETPSYVGSPGAAYEIVSPWDHNDLDGLQYAQLNDTVYFTHPNYAPYKLSRFANNNWELVPFETEWPATLGDNKTKIEINVTGGAPATPGPTWTVANYSIGDKVVYKGVNYVCVKPITSIAPTNPYTKAPGTYTSWRDWWAEIDLAPDYGIGATFGLESNEPLFDAGHVGSVWIIKHRREDPTIDLALEAALDATSDPLFVLGDWTCTISVNEGGTWQRKAVIERSYDLITWETLKAITSTGVASENKTGTELDPCWLRLRIIQASGTPPDEASFTLEASDSFHYGILKVTSFVSSEEVEVLCLFPPGDDAATMYWEEGAWSTFRGFPRAVAFHENRLFFAGTRARPLTIWGSTIDDYPNFRVSGDDDAGLSLTLASDAANGIQSLCSQRNLIALTTGSEWAIGKRDAEKTMTPATATAKRDTQFGSASIQAFPLGESVIYIQRSEQIVRSFSWSFEDDGYRSNDLTLMAEHIAGTGIRQIAAQKNPYPTFWCVLESGQLAGLLYDRRQNIAGWFRYTTGERIVGGETVYDSFESIAWVSGQEEDEGWVLVKRTVDGADVRYIERFQPDKTRKLKSGGQNLVCDADCAVIKTISESATVTGLGHLEGREVVVLANGSPQPPLVVDSSGEVELQFEATDIVAGLQFTAYLTPTFLETNDPATLSKVAKKRIVKVYPELWKSLGVEMSADGGTTWEKLEFRKPGDNMDQAVPLFTGLMKPRNLRSSSVRQAAIMLRSQQPVPNTIQSLHIEYELNKE